MKINFYWHNYRYFPYEKDLARLELLSLTKTKPKLKNGALTIDISKKWKEIAYKTTYFREAVAEDKTKIIPQQTLFELSANGLHEGIISGVNFSLNRQSTRFSSHGLHEFRGKYNPQIVRAIGNIVGLQSGEWILDPFCGSGTTLLESAHIGWNAVGVELNPLGVEITNAKILSMKVSEEELIAESAQLRENLKRRWKNYSYENSFTKNQFSSAFKGKMDEILKNLDYLIKWFSKSVLIQIATIIEEINNIKSQKHKKIFWVVLSDILRLVSLQDPGDLRIRRRKLPAPNYPAIPIFLESLSSKIKNIIYARKFLPSETGYQKAILGDSRFLAESMRSLKLPKKDNLFDAAITSPPYATALPYIDTFRLSLTLLNLIKSNEIQKSEKELIGSREITERNRKNYYELMDNNQGDLPEECIDLCRKLRRAIDIRTDGFRRKNVPVLLFKYFADMQLTFKQVYEILRKKAPYAIVIGKNRTTLGGKQYLIDTPRLLTRLAEDCGFSLEKKIKLNTYQRFDVHRTNSIRYETLLILRKE